MDEILYFINHSQLDIITIIVKHLDTPSIPNYKIMIDF